MKNTAKIATYIAISMILFAMPAIMPAQDRDKSRIMGYIATGNDTLYVDRIPAVYCFGRPDKRKRDKNWREYYRTVYNFNKVYPYALKAKIIINDADSTIRARNLKGSEREKYLKSVEKQLFREFEKPIRNLTISQGKMLMRLIERECGLSSYYIIRNYRGKAAAGFWQGIARLFGSDMKKPYDRFGEDRILEELVTMYMNGSFRYLYISIFGMFDQP